MNLPQADQRRFGRLPAPDPRDRKFAISRQYLASLPTAKHWLTGKILDQLDTPQCVEFSGRQWLATSPIRNAWSKPSGWLYGECQRNDEWSGEDYDGTSVRALFKVLQRERYISQYGWAWDVETITGWILSQGPMVVGTDWHEGMLETDRHGFVHTTGFGVGGHAFVLKGCNRLKKCPDGTTGAYRLANSWGRFWGDGGYAWISIADFAKLLSNLGEACTAIELKV
jgi:hypothetical protein